MKAPTTCLYCNSEPRDDDNECGFCEKGKPLDTQEDWDRTWGAIFES